MKTHGLFKGLQKYLMSKFKANTKDSLNKILKLIIRLEYFQKNCGKCLKRQCLPKASIKE